MKSSLFTLAIVLCAGLTAHAQSGRRKPPVAAPTPPLSSESKSPAPTKPDEPTTPPVTAEKNQDYRCTDDGTLAHLMDDPANVSGYESKEVDTRAEITERPEPKYTEEARRVGVQGVVVLKVLLGPNGRIDRIRVLKRLPYGLTESAIHAACGVKFKPAIKDGKEVAQWVSVDYGFRLSKSSIFGP